MNNDDYWLYLWFTVIFACIVSMVAIACNNHVWKIDAIKHNIGEYSTTTGEFQWKK